MHPYITHQIFLAAALGHTEGPVLELGCGEGSTMWLHGLCAAQDRRLVSLESNAEWLDRFRWLESDLHTFRLVDDWRTCPEYQDTWGVVFVDHGDPANRGTSVQLLKGKAHIFVCHDSCHAKLYRYDEVFHTFKHLHHSQRLLPNTTVLSDDDDLSFLNKL